MTQTGLFRIQGDCTLGQDYNKSDGYHRQRAGALKILDFGDSGCVNCSDQKQGRREWLSVPLSVKVESFRDTAGV